MKPCGCPEPDHASIATEARIVEEMSKRVSQRSYRAGEISKTRLGMEEKYGSRIISQLKSWAPPDWERERFTMDEGCSRVREVFVRLYERAYLPRRADNQPVHQCKTSISDAEVEFEEKDAAFTTCVILLRTAVTLSFATTARKPCWATPPWRYTPRTKDTQIWLAKCCFADC